MPTKKKRAANDATAKKKRAHAVVKKLMPGWRIVDEGAHADSREGQADAQSVDLNVLREKYLGKAQAADSIDQSHNSTAQIVVVEPQNADAYHRRAGRKAVVVSGDKIIGSQG